MITDVGTFFYSFLQGARKKSGFIALLVLFMYSLIYNNELSQSSRAPRLSSGYWPTALDVTAICPVRALGTLGTGSRSTYLSTALSSFASFPSPQMFCSKVLKTQRPRPAFTPLSASKPEHFLCLGVLVEVHSSIPFTPIAPLYVVPLQISLELFQPERLTPARNRTGPGSGGVSKGARLIPGRMRDHRGRNSDRINFETNRATVSEGLLLIYPAIRRIAKSIESSGSNPYYKDPLLGPSTPTVSTLATGIYLRIANPCAVLFYY
ncbi:hypothetical protein B0H19DRAFT_1082136 [Mycena capillaripes]|nr:hypothetical protein B0H19DRAFT_1082136 [Mycena capillaripes]